MGFPRDRTAVMGFPGYGIAGTRFSGDRTGGLGFLGDGTTGVAFTGDGTTGLKLLAAISGAVVPSFTSNIVSSLLSYLDVVASETA